MLHPWHRMKLIFYLLVQPLQLLRLVACLQRIHVDDHPGLRFQTQVLMLQLIQTLAQ